MGLFSSEYKTYVATVAQRVIKDDLLPNAMKTGVSNAIFKGTDIIDEVMEGLVGGLGLKTEQMFDYAGNHYTHGLPSGQFTAANAGLEEYSTVLSAQEGSPVSIVYYRYGHANLLHLGWMQLIAVHGYNPSTNELPGLSAEKLWPVYLKDMVVVVPSLDAVDPTALELWGIAARAGYTKARPYAGITGSLLEPSPVEVNPSAMTPYVRVSYTWQPMVPAGGDVSFTLPNLEDDFTIQLASLFDPEADYFHAKYRVGGVDKYAAYKVGTGTYPALDDLHLPPPSLGGTFFPFAYFRYNKRSEIVDKETPSYITTKKLVKYLGMDFDQVADTIDQNPNIADVEQAMLMLSVPAVTSDHLEQRYLFDFFQEMWAADPNQLNTLTSASWIEFFAGNASAEDPIKGGLIIQDKRFKMALTHSGITRERKAGSIGVIGAHDSGTQTSPVVRAYFDPTQETTQYATETIKQHYYRRQISQGIYDEIVVSNLRMRYHVFGIYTVTADEDQDILLVPLDHALTKHYSITDRETLYARSLHYIFNSRVVVEIRWYQQDFFQLFMVVVAVVIAVYTGQFEILAQALAGSSAAVITLAVNLLESMVLSTAFKLFAKEVGGQAALVIAAIAVVVAGIQVLESGSIAGAPWAQDLLKLATGLTKGVSAYYADAMKDLAGDAKAELEWEDQAKKDLEAGQKLLENDNYLNPFVIFGESPNEFYNRTIHSGNIGTISISAISNYVETALRLPRLDDTLGDHAHAK